MTSESGQLSNPKPTNAIEIAAVVEIVEAERERLTVGPRKLNHHIRLRGSGGGRFDLTSIKDDHGRCQAMDIAIAPLERALIRTDANHDVRLEQPLRRLGLCAFQKEVWLMACDHARVLDVIECAEPTLALSFVVLLRVRVVVTCHIDNLIGVTGYLMMGSEEKL